MITTLVVTIVFFAAFVQTLSGFGFALIVMPLTTIVMSLQTAAPLVALTGLTLCTINLVRYRQAVNIREVLRLAAASALGIPIGLWVLSNVDEITIFKSVGLAIQDVSTATKVYQLAKEKGVDKTLSLMQAVSERYAFRTKSLS